MDPHNEPVTLLLHAMRAGDAGAADRLLPLVYAELHRLAKGYMRREREGHTLQPTALIHEAFLRLAPHPMDWQSREHFVAVAATVMRRVLVDHARSRNAEMRGGGVQHMALEEAQAAGGERSIDILALDQALARLAEREPRQARIVELKYFAGLGVEEIAALTGVAPRTVKRDWALARLWLFEQLQGPGTQSDGAERNPH